MQHLVKYCQCYGSAYHCFSTFWTSGTLQNLAVDFAHNLHFQVRLVEDECRAVAHHIRVIQASGTNNTKSTTELSPVLIRILLRVQTPEPRLHMRLLVGLSRLSHARGEAGEDVVPLLLVNNCSGDIGLQLSHF